MFSLQISEVDVVPNSSQDQDVNAFEQHLGFGNQTVLDIFRQKYNCYNYGAPLLMLQVQVFAILTPHTRQSCAYMHVCFFCTI